MYEGAGSLVVGSRRHGYIIYEGAGSLVVRSRRLMGTLNMKVQVAKWLEAEGLWVYYT